MKRIFSLSILIFLIVPLFQLEAFSGSGVNITKDGAATITDAKVTMIAGNTIYTRLYWGEAFIRLLVKTNDKTKFFRGTGELTTISEISLGDYLELSGQLDGGNILMMTASSVKNSSVQKKQNTFSGKVESVNYSGNNFILNDSKQGRLMVQATSTTRFIKGNRTLDLTHIVAGDTITKASGDYNLTTKTLVADTVVTYVDLNIYKLQNFQGILKEINGTTLPTSIKILIDGKLYTVNLTSKTSILNKNRGAVSLNRFVVDDLIRIYGNILELDEPIIDNVQVIRNLNL